jgi:hypothetical protein
LWHKWHCKCISWLTTLFQESHQLFNQALIKKIIIYHFQKAIDRMGNYYWQYKICFPYWHCEWIFNRKSAVTQSRMIECSYFSEISNTNLLKIDLYIEDLFAFVKYFSVKENKNKNTKWIYKLCFSYDSLIEKQTLVL